MTPIPPVKEADDLACFFIIMVVFIVGLVIGAVSQAIWG